MKMTKRTVQELAYSEVKGDGELLDEIRKNEEIAFSVAISGTAALLLRGGCTAHSTFGIPLDCLDSSMCGLSYSDGHHSLSKVFKLKQRIEGWCSLRKFSSLEESCISLDTMLGNTTFANLTEFDVSFQYLWLQ